MDNNKVKQRKRLSNSQVVLIYTILIFIMRTVITVFNLGDIIFNFVIPLGLIFGLVYALALLIVGIFRCDRH